jgi:alkylation response protein AidB-like acyl-CoA dehydrogenase
VPIGHMTSLDPAETGSVRGSELVDTQFAAAVSSGRLDLPLPGRGKTRERWAAFAQCAEEDLSLARLCEGHADALAILAEVTGEQPEGGRWGVWAAEPPGPNLQAARRGGKWRLDGIKQYCSGAHTCTNALVTASGPDGPRLFAISTRALRPIMGTGPSVGMSASDTLNVSFADIEATPVGPPGAYTQRPGFAHGGVGVAACWFGGARAIAKTLHSAAKGHDRIDPYALAHLGAVDIALVTARSALDQAADGIDADPHDVTGSARVRALRVRALVESAATEVMTRVGRALGAAPLCQNEAHARKVADLTVYLRQHHAERSLAELGALIAAGAPEWL